MARTVLTVQILNGAFTAPPTALTMTAADVANGNQFAMAKGDKLIVQNTDVSSHNFTLSSIADPFSRTGDIGPQALAAGAITVYGPLDFPGWIQTDGSFHLSADNAGIKFAIIRSPA